MTAYFQTWPTSWRRVAQLVKENAFSLWSRKGQSFVTNLSPRTIRSRTNPVSILCFPRWVLVLFFHLSLGLPESLPLSFLTKICTLLLHLPHLQHTLHPFLIIPGKGTNDEFLIMTYVSVCCDWLTRKSKYAPQHSVFSLCSSVILPG